MTKIPTGPDFLAARDLRDALLAKFDAGATLTKVERAKLARAEATLDAGNAILGLVFGLMTLGGK